MDYRKKITCVLSNGRKKLNGWGCVKVQLFTHLPPLQWPFEPYPFVQLYTNSSSLAIPAQVLKSNSYTEQADYLSIRKAEVHALKTNWHVFHLQKRHQSALFSYWSCKQQYLAIRETHQLHSLVYKQKAKQNKTKQQQKATKKPNKQLSIFISLLLSPNASCISTV